MKLRLSILALGLSMAVVYADFCPKCGKEVKTEDKFCAGCGKALREGEGEKQPQQQEQQQQVNVNVNVNVGIKESQAYAPSTTAYAEPDEEHGYKITSSKVYEFKDGLPMDIPLPGVDRLFLRLAMQNSRDSLGGFMGVTGDRVSLKEIVNAGQIARDHPALPCLLCEWSYRAVDRDNSLLGVLVTMVDPRLTVMREPLRVMTPNGPQVVERVQGVTMDPMLRVTIWRKQ